MSKEVAHIPDFKTEEKRKQRQDDSKEEATKKIENESVQVDDYQETSSPPPTGIKRTIPYEESGQKIEIPFYEVGPGEFEVYDRKGNRIGYIEKERVPGNSINRSYNDALLDHQETKYFVTPEGIDLRLEKNPSGRLSYTYIEIGIFETDSNDT